MFTYANFLLPDLLLPANMQPPHAQGYVESPTSAPTTPCYSSLGLSGLPGPLPHREEVGLGEIRGGHFQKRKGQERANPLLQSFIQKSQPCSAALLKGRPHTVFASLRCGRASWPLI